MVEATTKEFKLPNTVLKLKPIKRARGKHGEIGVHHEANFLFGNAKNTFSPIIMKKGITSSPLTREEQEFFEDPNRSGLPFERGHLSVHNKKEDNFWISKESRIRLGEDPIEFDLSDPMSYIKYKILLSNDEIICPDPEYLEPTHPKNKLTYKYVFEPLNYHENKKAEKYDRTRDIYKFLGRIEANRSAMINFLTLINPKKRVPANATMELLRGELNSYAENMPDKFIEIMKDEDRDVKALIKRAVDIGALNREAMSFSLPDGRELGENLKDTIEFLKNPENQKVLDLLKVKTDK